MFRINEDIIVCALSATVVCCTATVFLAFGAAAALASFGIYEIISQSNTDLPPWQNELAYFIYAEISTALSVLAIIVFLCVRTRTNWVSTSQKSAVMQFNFRALATAKPLIIAANLVLLIADIVYGFVIARGSQPGLIYNILQILIWLKVSTLFIIVSFAVIFIAAVFISATCINRGNL